MKKEMVHNPTSMVFVINTIALLIVGLLVIYYVIQANIVAASDYKISLLNQKLESLNEVNSSLAAQKSLREDPAKVLDFALRQNMVEAKNAAYLFESGNIAYEKP